MVHYPFLGQNRRDPTQAPREKGDPLDPRAACGGEERSSGRECGGRPRGDGNSVEEKTFHNNYSILFKNNICIHLCIQLIITHIMPYKKLITYF